MACDPLTIPTDADCFDCIPPAMHAAVQSYLLARIRGGSMDVNEIVREAACNSSCIPPGTIPRIKTYLLCQLSNTGGETPIPEPPECDADAQAFITAAGLTDDTQIGAVCVLVRDLKAYPTVGTKFWDREVLIYPFVGGNATSHAVNLRTPGTNNLLFVGASPPLHSARGVQGQAVAGCWANTQYLIPVARQNNVRTSMYVDLDSTSNALGYYGTASAAAFQSVRLNAIEWRGTTNDATIANGPAMTNPLGIRFAQRIDANNRQCSHLLNPWFNMAVASTGVSQRYLYLFALDGAGGVPTGTGTGNSNVRLSSFTLGDPFDVGGGQVEKDQYKSIWDSFHSTLGRAHP